MSNKVELIYEDGQYSVMLNGKLVNSDKDVDNSFGRFKQVIKDNVVVNANSWESIETALKMYSLEGLDINCDYKAATYGNMKFFYNSGKVFYIADGKMIQLIGGFYLFNFVIEMISSGDLKDYEGLLKFCEEVLKHKASYRITESNFVVASPAFNYGACEYNFYSNKIHKGASIVKGSFEDYTEYVFSVLKA